MAKIVLTYSLLLLFFNSNLYAQNQKNTNQEQQFSSSELLSSISSEVKPTPEMWFYLQETRRQDDSKLIMRRKAEHRAVSRRNRIAARKWFGLSNARPNVSVNPWSNYYSPVWTGSHGNRYQWAGSYYQPRVVLQFESVGSRLR